MKICGNNINDKNKRTWNKRTFTYTYFKELSICIDLGLRDYGSIFYDGAIQLSNMHPSIQKDPNQNDKTNYFKKWKIVNMFLF